MKPLILNSKIHVVLQVLGEIKEIYFSDSSFDSSDHELHVSTMLYQNYLELPLLLTCVGKKSRRTKE